MWAHISAHFGARMRVMSFLVRRQGIAVREDESRLQAGGQPHVSWRLRLWRRGDDDVTCRRLHTRCMHATCHLHPYRPRDVDFGAVRSVVKRVRLRILLLSRSAPARTVSPASSGSTGTQRHAPLEVGPARLAGVRSRASGSSRPALPSLNPCVPASRRSCRAPLSVRLSPTLVTVRCPLAEGAMSGGLDEIVSAHGLHGRWPNARRAPLSRSRCSGCKLIDCAQVSHERGSLACMHRVR